MRTRIIGILSTEDTEGTDRRKLSTELFFCSLRLEILGEILIKNGRGQKCYGSTEHTEDTDHREFLVASLEILEEIFV